MYVSPYVHFFLPPSLEWLNVMFKVLGNIVDSYQIRVLLLLPVVDFNGTDSLLGSVKREEITPCASILGGVTEFAPRSNCHTFS